ncbi:MAG: carboxypeptidase-like regulatory domain-containing protein [Planctomycetota bacterium]|nr:carboxypeptidase-like regulatory domain-containing protein [Planctomycetota bacterium]
MKALLSLVVAVETAVLLYLVFVPPEPTTATPLAPPSLEEGAEEAEREGPGLAGDAQPDAGAGADEAVDAPAGEVPTEVVFHGRYTDTAGAVVPVYVSSGLVSPQGGVYVCDYREDSGHFARSGVPPGTYRYRAMAEGYRTHDVMLEIPAGIATLEHDVQLEALVGIPVYFLTPDGKPLAQSVPAAAEWLGRSVSALATTDAPPARLRATRDAAQYAFGRGDFIPKALERDAKRKDGRDGTLYIRGDFPVQVGAYLRQERIEVRQLTEAPERLDFRVDPGAIESRLSGIRFRLTSDADASELEEVIVLLHDTTSGEPEEDAFDREGDTFTIRNHPPGGLHLQIHAGESLAPFLRNVELPAGELLDLGTIHLGPLVRQQVRMVDAEKQPIAGATVWPFDMEAGWMAQSGMPIRFSSDATGIVRLAVGAIRQGLLIRTPDGDWANAELDLRTPQEDVVELQLPSFVKLTLRTGDETLPISVRVLDAQKAVVTARKMSTPTIWALGLPEGRYTLRITDRDGEERDRPLVVKAPMTRAIVIE